MALRLLTASAHLGDICDDDIPTHATNSSADHASSRTALVTGASSGIGEDATRRLQALGYTV